MRKALPFSILLFSILTSLLTPSAARAEYRAYDLTIEDSTTGQKRSVLTTLDDMQYAEYHPVRSTEFVVIADTWMCRQRTDFSQDPYQRLCPNPRAGAAPAPAAQPASQPAP